MQVFPQSMQVNHEGPQGRTIHRSTHTHTHTPARTYKGLRVTGAEMTSQTLADRGVSFCIHVDAW